MSKLANSKTTKQYLNFEFKKGLIPPLKFGAGFTLLETIVALAIITAAAVGPVVLITRGILSFGFSKNKLIALNLAQEGIELVREFRENNVICDQLNGNPPYDWMKHAVGGGSINNEELEADISTTDPIDCSASIIQTPHFSNNADTKLHLNPATGIYGYTGSQITIFTRKINIDKPSADGGIPANAQRDITSTVSWIERNIAREVKLKERLYDWR